MGVLVIVFQFLDLAYESERQLHWHTYLFVSFALSYWYCEALSYAHWTNVIALSFYVKEVIKFKFLEVTFKRYRIRIRNNVLKFLSNGQPYGASVRAVGLPPWTRGALVRKLAT